MNFLVILTVALFATVSSADEQVGSSTSVPVPVTPSPVPVTPVVKFISNVVVDTLKNHSVNFTSYEFYRQKVANYDPLRLVNIDIEDAALIWDVEEPKSVKSLSPSTVEFKYEVSASYFYINGTFRGSENQTAIYTGETVSFLDGKLGIDVRTIFDRKHNRFLFDTQMKNETLKFVHHITWDNCPVSKELECEKVKNGTLDTFLPNEIQKEIEKRVHLVLYASRHVISQNVTRAVLDGRFD